MGHSYRHLGQLEEAEAAYKKVLQLYSPDHLIAHLSLAALYSLMGRAKEAGAEAAEVMRIDPKFSFERFSMIFPFRSQKRIAKTIEAYRQAGLK